MATLSFKGVNKIYPGDVHAVKDFNFEVKDKEFIVFVGPSGCGKTTTLRMIAGLEAITSGTISIDGNVINDLPPKDRDIAMVFQNYALYPHMDVYTNMAFGLKLRKVPKAEIDTKVREAAEILDITQYLNRKPNELSGGQMQRVALGRAIVRNSKVYLFDEPLSNLDAKLRVEMRAEINRLHNKLQATMIYVTHDQIEAMTLGDRIVIMLEGIVQQVADPVTLYDFPVNKFVGSFIGTPAMNFLDGSLSKNGEEFIFSVGDFKVEIPKAYNESIADMDGKDAFLGIRPEHVNDANADKDSKMTPISGTVEVIERLGHEILVYVSVAGQKIIMKEEAHYKTQVGDIVKLCFDFEKLHIFNKGDNENNLTLDMDRSKVNA